MNKKISHLVTPFPSGRKGAIKKVKDRERKREEKPRKCFTPEAVKRRQKYPGVKKQKVVSALSGHIFVTSETRQVSPSSPFCPQGNDSITTAPEGHLPEHQHVRETGSRALPLIPSLSSRGNFPLSSRLLLQNPFLPPTPSPSHPSPFFRAEIVKACRKMRAVQN